MKNLMILLAAVAMFGGCGQNPASPEETPRPVPSKETPPEIITDVKAVDDLRASALDSLTIGANNFVLEAYLWRDFMPVYESEEVAKNGRPMNAVNWLVDVNSTPIPRGVSLEKQYVLYEGQMWVAEYETEVPAQQASPYKLERLSIGGPKWGPNVYVDVVAEISVAGKRYFIIRKNVHIDHTS